MITTKGEEVKKTNRYLKCMAILAMIVISFSMLVSLCNSASLNSQYEEVWEGITDKNGQRHWHRLRRFRKTSIKNKEKINVRKSKKQINKKKGVMAEISDIFAGIITGIIIGIIIFIPIATLLIILLYILWKILW